MMEKLRVLDAFAGLGAFSLGFDRAGGFETIGFIEIDPYCQEKLAQHWPNVPIHSDIRTYDAKDHERPNVITGGFPCQDLSIAGRRAGLEGERSGLWSELERLIGDFGPDIVVLENVTNLLAGPAEQPGGWFGRILADLAALGYDAEWHCIPMSAIGAPHQRDRTFILAYPRSEGREGPIITRESLRLTERTTSTQFGDRIISCGPEWPELSSYLRVGDGLSRWSPEIKALGNSIGPGITQRIGQAILTSNQRR